MRSIIHLEVKASPGCSIREACAEAVELAKKLHITIDFDFNGVKCMAKSNTDVDYLVGQWEAAIDSDRKYKFAVG